MSIAHAQQRTFDAWLEDFRSAALAASISPATVDAALAGLTPLEEVVERDRAQPEFTLDFRGYLTRVVSQSRIEEGQRMLAEHGELLRNVGKRYGMPPELLAAVWGIESNYGRTQGNFSVVQALATLAYDGRRGPMFRSQLLNALRILDQGHVELGAMKGSWAGAMGQLQFMPTTFIEYAKDGDGDGRKDIWGSAADALESAANFMSSNWQSGTAVGTTGTSPRELQHVACGTEPDEDARAVAGARRPAAGGRGAAARQRAGVDRLPGHRHARARVPRLPELSRAAALEPLELLRDRRRAPRRPDRRRSAARRVLTVTGGAGPQRLTGASASCVRAPFSEFGTE